MVWVWSVYSGAAQCGGGNRGWNLAEDNEITEIPHHLPYLAPGRVNCCKTASLGFLDGHVKSSKCSPLTSFPPCGIFNSSFLRLSVQLCRV